MANTIDNLQATVIGDAVTITGTVNGKTYTVNAWLSHINSLANKAAKRTYVAGLLNAAYNADPSNASTTIDLTGTPIVL
jgi:hypothetical protein